MFIIHLYSNGDDNYLTFNTLFKNNYLIYERPAALLVCIQRKIQHMIHCSVGV